MKQFEVAKEIVDRLGNGRISDAKLIALSSVFAELHPNRTGHQVIEEAMIYTLTKLQGCQIKLPVD
jgi:hypothetical protein